MIDTSITVDALSTRPGAVAVAGGSFTTSGAVTVNADSYAGTSVCLSMVGATQNGDSYGSNSTNNISGSSVGAGSVQNGDAIGGSGSLRRGSIVENGGILNGNAYGGTATGANGATIRQSGIQNGNAYASDTAAAFGTVLQSRGRLNGNAYGGAFAGSYGADVITGGVVNGNSFGGGGAGSYGINLTGGTHNGDSHAGSGSAAHGTLATSGAVCYGRQFGSAAIVNAFGTRVITGSVCITAGTTDDVSAGLRLDADGAVVLQNGTAVGQVSIGTTVGRYEIGETLPDYPYIASGSGSGGFSLSRVLN
jgi:hypothetical protein